MRATRFTLALLAVFALAATGTLTGCGSSGGNDYVPEVPFSHAEYFAANPYEGDNLNTVCVGCHTDEAADLLETGHWQWEGTATNIEGHEGHTHGKTDLLNNFCIAIPSNEGRCTQCHIGVGWVDDSFDFDDATAIDCIVCHDTTGLYAKHPTMGGGGGKPVKNIPSEWPGGSTLLTPAEWDQIGSNVGDPGRANCGFCHYKAGGGNNVKHGDLAVNLNNTTREYDVHMGTDGADYSCQTCHEADAEHGIGGMPIHHVTEGNMQQCEDCHSGTNAPDHSAMNGTLAMHVDLLACQVCHVPAIGRHTKTKIWWDWSEANQQGPDTILDADGYPIYDRKKGEFIWEWDVRPALRRFDGKWNRRMIGENDTWTNPGGMLQDEGPDNGLFVHAEPSATWTGAAKIYPFKRMRGVQPVDMDNQRVLVPHLFGTAGGASPYWGNWDWDAALADGATYTGQPYSGTPGFLETVMYMAVNHEVAPKEMALGYENCCADCHGDGNDHIQWEFLRADGVDPFPGAAPCGD